MVQIKVTPEQLEQVAQRVRTARYDIETIHKQLYNQMEDLCSRWSGAAAQSFYYMFNDTKPKVFVIINEMDKIADELIHSAVKFREVDKLAVEIPIEEGAMCGKPKSDLEKAWEGLYDGAGKGVGDAWEGFLALGDGETWSNMWDAVVNYDETLPAMWNAFSDSFMDDVWHGDVESGFRWGSYLVTSVGLGFLGGKGLDKVSTLARGARFSKITQITPPRLQPALAGVGLTGEGILSTLPSSGNWGNYLSSYLMFARPHWRESEKHAYEKYPNYKDQVSFKDREEVPYASKGSTRPDGFDHDLNSSLEVKNYNLTTERGKRSLINVLLKQFEYRLKNLPEGAEQIAFIDARGQNVSVQTLKEIKEELSQRTFGKLKVTIERD
ncbi:type VII secretion protein [Bacillus cereus]|uniref:Type VII secretion protein n=1 Tax=Bacillus thuringiensis TaxID=1428 RepID=A0AB36VEQ7_BACTU|nr:MULTISPECIES: WXG100 family type VII secretion target [Bacillus cereus group]PDZ55655.1 type VII secretion protein [Bacillus cereus]PFC28434.1 type VII secretion protein [Bacillus thuringiensis]PFO26269.1 type VII secretion protein [Bacillus thuringiensis]PFS40275.1 type VII secretion protein [Bacillus thuringiensis]PFS58268.1 type VII secretion protein [Bacillus thuringiensis]